MSLAISILPGSNVSIHRQIVEQVCAAIYAGKVGDDEPLPSVRVLAEQLVVNPNTVAKAYAELSREGVIEARPGRGMFVSQRKQIYTWAERTRRIEAAITTLIAEATMLGFTADEIVERVSQKVRSFVPPGKSTPAKGGTK